MAEGAAAALADARRATGAPHEELGERGILRGHAYGLKDLLMHKLTP